MKKVNKFQRRCLRNGDNVKIQEYAIGARKTAIYPSPLIYPTLGLCGEIAELSVACTQHDLWDGVPGEIGDVLWYVCNVAHDCDLTLEQVVGRKTFPTGICGSENAILEMKEMWEFAGVVAENVKKAVRDNGGELTKKRKANIRKSLKGIIHMLACVAESFDTTLSACAALNNHKLTSRQKRGKLGGDGDNR
jgi:hypothetical protein